MRDSKAKAPDTAYGVLGMLTFGQMSGYDLTKAIEGSIGFFWAPAKSQLYAELRRLVTLGWAREREVEQTDRPDKRIYTITPAGEGALRTWLGTPPAPHLAGAAAHRARPDQEPVPAAVVLRAPRGGRRRAGPGCRAPPAGRGVARDLRGDRGSSAGAGRAAAAVPHAHLRHDLRAGRRRMVRRRAEGPGPGDDDPSTEGREGMS